MSMLLTWIQPTPRSHSLLYYQSLEQQQGRTAPTTDMNHASFAFVKEPSFVLKKKEEDKKQAASAAEEKAWLEKLDASQRDSQDALPVYVDDRQTSLSVPSEPAARKSSMSQIFGRLRRGNSSSSSSSSSSKSSASKADEKPSLDQDYLNQRTHSISFQS